MEQSRAARIAEPTPMFGAYRRGYDPDQVDRYVAEQQRRLDEAQLRATDAEGKLSAAVGQLRELHRRVGDLEQHQQRSGPPVRLDGVGEHVQRMFEEARRAADSLRSSTESELADLRGKTIDEARSIVAGARRKSEEIEDEIERRRREQLDRLEEERNRATAQLTYVHEQRKNAVAELMRLREVIDATIAEVAPEPQPDSASSDGPPPPPPRTIASRFEEPRSRAPMREVAPHQSRSNAFTPRAARPALTPETREFDATADRGFDTARLVREHRARASSPSDVRRMRAPIDRRVERRAALSIFDYEAQ